MSDSESSSSGSEKEKKSIKKKTTKSKIEDKPKKDKKKDEEFEQTFKTYKIVNEDGDESEIRLYEYTEKSVMIKIPKSVGKKYAEILKEKNGKYNKNLTIDGEKTPGWIFKRTDKEKALKAIKRITEKVLESDIDFENEDN